MARQQPPSDDLLALAAELRVAGVSWEEIARRVRRAVSSVRQWPSHYAARWHRFRMAAEQQQLADATVESIHTLRRLLRSKDEKTCREAAAKLIQYRAASGRLRRRGTRSTLTSGAADAKALCKILHGLDDAGLARLIAELLESSANPGRGAAD
jgi:hypothetical protein